MFERGDFITSLYLLFAHDLFPKTGAHFSGSCLSETTGHFVAY
jgi:hypothetical protein